MRSDKCHRNQSMPIKAQRRRIKAFMKGLRTTTVPQDSPGLGLDSLEDTFYYNSVFSEDTCTR